MALNITTDYALRIILYLAQNEDKPSVSGKEISEKMAIPYNYFLKIIPNLKNAGLIESFQGKKGGYALLKDPKEITPLDVIKAMGDDFIVSYCLADPNACSRHAVDYCKAHKMFDQLQADINKALSSASMKELSLD